MKEIIKDIVVESRHLNGGFIVEKGLGRLRDLMLRGEFAILTAFRGNKTLKQNRDNNKSLIQLFNSKKMGIYRLVGHWQEAPDDIDYSKALELGLTVDTEEDSLFIPKPKDVSSEEFRDVVVDVMNKYQQDAIILKDAQGVKLVYRSGGEDLIGSAPQFDKIAQAYSHLRGRKNVPFVFEGTVSPVNNIGRQAFAQRGILWVSFID